MATAKQVSAGKKYGDPKPAPLQPRAKSKPRDGHVPYNGYEMANTPPGLDYRAPPGASPLRVRVCVGMRIFVHVHILCALYICG